MHELYQQKEVIEAESISLRSQILLLAGKTITHLREEGFVGNLQKGINELYEIGVKVFAPSQEIRLGEVSRTEGIRMYELLVGPDSNPVQKGGIVTIEPECDLRIHFDWSETMPIERRLDDDVVTVLDPPTYHSMLFNHPDWMAPSYYIANMADRACKENQSKAHDAIAEAPADGLVMRGREMMPLRSSLDTPAPGIFYSPSKGFKVLSPGERVYYYREALEDEQAILYSSPLYIGPEPIFGQASYYAEILEDGDDLDDGATLSPIMRDKNAIETVNQDQKRARIKDQSMLIEFRQPTHSSADEYRAYREDDDAEFISPLDQPVLARVYVVMRDMELPEFVDYVRQDLVPRCFESLGIAPEAWYIGGSWVGALCEYNGASAAMLEEDELKTIGLPKDSHGKPKFSGHIRNGYFAVHKR